MRWLATMAMAKGDRFKTFINAPSHADKVLN